MKVSSKMNVVDVVSVQLHQCKTITDSLFHFWRIMRPNIVTDYHTADRGFSLGKLLKRNGIRGRNFESFVRR